MKSSAATSPVVTGGRALSGPNGRRVAIPAVGSPARSGRLGSVANRPERPEDSDWTYLTSRRSGSRGRWGKGQYTPGRVSSARPMTIQLERMVAIR